MDPFASVFREALRKVAAVNGRSDDALNLAQGEGIESDLLLTEVFEECERLRGDAPPVGGRRSSRGERPLLTRRIGGFVIPRLLLCLVLLLALLLVLLLFLRPLVVPLVLVLPLLLSHLYS